MGTEALENHLPCPPEDRYVGPGPRVTAGEFELTLKAVSHSPIINGLMEAMHGLVAVVNERRQIVALNSFMLSALGIGDPKSILGLRLGEALDCIHAEENSMGCGNSTHCSSCGAAIAQLLCLRSQKPVERLCAIDTNQQGADSHLYFRVRVSPLPVGSERLMLLFLQDVTHEQRMACLERIFLHDLNNTATGLSLMTSELLEGDTPANPDIIKDLAHFARRLTREIELQRCLALSSFKLFQCEQVTVPIASLFADLDRSSHHHPSAIGRTIEFLNPVPDRTLASDPTVLHRILYNMVINALEATGADDVIRVSAVREDGYEVIQVWNPGTIPADVAKSIFRRNFSTKGSIGRGLGTYSMKILGEHVLGGIVSFTSSGSEGTCFRLALRPGNSSH